MKKFDLTWGESVCVRDAFLETISGGPALFGLEELHHLGYPKHEGDPDLVEITRQVIERQVGSSYTHVLLTNGAAGAVTLALRAYRQKGYEICHLNEPPFFPVYPSMVHSAGFESYSYGKMNADYRKKVRLIDSPSNPKNEVMEVIRPDIDTAIVWDAVYHNKVYMKFDYKPIEHDVLIGSYSKLTGLNGIRVGWLATNDDLLFERFRELITAEYCGISVPSTAILKKYLSRFWWDSFEQNANFRLDFNREQWSKLEKYFGGQPVSPIGMFYYAPIDKACKKLMEKSHVLYMPGSSCGTTDDFARFNIGQDCRTVKKAVEAILRNDKC